MYFSIKNHAYKLYAGSSINLSQKKKKKQIILCLKRFLLK